MNRQCEGGKSTAHQPRKYSATLSVRANGKWMPAAEGGKETRIKSGRAKRGYPFALRLLQPARRAATRPRTVPAPSPVGEAAVVLLRLNEGPDHLGADEVAAELVELPEPEAVAGSVRVAPHVTHVLHHDEGRRELGLNKLLTLDQLPQDVVALRTGFEGRHPGVTLPGAHRHARACDERVHELLVRQAAEPLGEAGPPHPLAVEGRLVGFELQAPPGRAHDDPAADLLGVALEFLQRGHAAVSRP